MNMVDLPPLNCGFTMHALPTELKALTKLALQTFHQGFVETGGESCVRGATSSTSRPQRERFPRIALRPARNIAFPSADRRSKCCANFRAITPSAAA